MVSFILCAYGPILLLASLVHAQGNYVIFGGTPAVVRTRMDPIISPGAVSSHVHEVFGGSGFSENYDYNQIIQSGCTTMPIPHDFSNYWTPPMYYVDPNNGSYTLMESTMNIYYLLRTGSNNDTLQPFPPGLRMLAGNNTRGTYNASNFADQAVSYVCLDYNNDHTGDPDWAEREDYFDHQCPDGMRAQVFFPSCWDGKNLDSTDHVSHMSYPVQNYNGGSCPDSHPVHLISLFYELFIPTGNFPYNGAGTWSLSNGDTRGLRFHGDFVMGWNDTSLLQNFIDNCPNAFGNTADCPAFAAVQDLDAPAACQFEGMIVNEDIGSDGAIAALPGCNKPWDGSGPQPTCSGLTSPGLIEAIEPLPSGWSDLGCIAEGTSGRALTGATIVASNMTKAFCSASCASQGFMYAGAEFGDECYCGNSFSNGASQTTVPSEQCNVRCAGNTLETCGGPDRLALLYNPQPGSSVTSTSVSSTSAQSSATSIPSTNLPVTSTPTTSLPSSDPSSTPSTSPTSSTSIIFTPTTVTSFSSISSSGPASSTPTSSTWTSAGCVSDGLLRALTGYTFSSISMTPTICQQVCASKSFSIAGLEFGAECYCGNSFANGLGNPVSSLTCTLPCIGDISEQCGGAFALSIYKLT